MWPLWLRPEPRIFFSVSDARGGPLWSCGLTTLTSARRPADVGLTFTRAISLHLLRKVDLLARSQVHIRLAHVAAPAVETTKALFLALLVQDLHRINLDLEEHLDCGLDFGLGRIQYDTEGDLLVLVGDHRALLRDDRAD